MEVRALWSEVLSLLEKTLEHSGAYRNIIAKVEPLILREDELILLIEDNFHREIFENRLNEVSIAVTSILNKRIDITIISSIDEMSGSSASKRPKTFVKKLNNKMDSNPAYLHFQLSYQEKLRLRLD